MKRIGRIAAALLAACMLGTSTLCTVTAEAQSSKPAVKATVSGEKIRLEWGRISGTSKYRVYIYKNKKLKTVTGVKSAA